MGTEFLAALKGSVLRGVRQLGRVILPTMNRTEMLALTYLMGTLAEIVTSQALFVTSYTCTEVQLRSSGRPLVWHRFVSRGFLAGLRRAS